MTFGRALARGLVLPLVRRFELGEGVLLAVNLSLVVAAGPGLARGAAEVFVSALALAVMYALNDWWDAARDLDNPRKDHALAALLHAQRRAFGALLAASHVLVVVLAAALGAHAALAALAALALNAFYSFLLKGIPVVDVAAVAAWGGAYAGIVGPAAAMLPVAAMTGVSHVFQALGDREPDARAGLRTSARSRALSLAVLGACTALLVAGLGMLGGALPALLGVVPFAAALVTERSLLAWRLSKAAFGVAWLVSLWVAHGPR